MEKNIERARKKEKEDGRARRREEPPIPSDENPPKTNANSSKWSISGTGLARMSVHPRGRLDDLHFR